MVPDRAQNRKRLTLIYNQLRLIITDNDFLLREMTFTEFMSQAYPEGYQQPPQLYLPQGDDEEREDDEDEEMEDMTSDKQELVEDSKPDVFSQNGGKSESEQDETEKQIYPSPHPPKFI